MTQKIERPSLATLQDILLSRTGGKYKIVNNMGHRQVCGPCPNCGGTDRFNVWLGDDGVCHWTCRHCPKPQTEKRLFEMLGLEWDGYIPCHPAKRFVPPVPDASILSGVKIDYSDIEKWHANGFDRAFTYFSPYGIDVCTADDFMLGYTSYTTSEGLHVAGYTIPSFYPLPNGKLAVKSVRIRRDDAAASPEMPKYIGVKTGAARGVFNWPAVNTADGAYQAKLLDAVFIGEAEKCAMAMTALFRRYHYSHVAAISYSPEAACDYYFDRIVANAAKVIVLQDNDDGPGLDRALKVQGLVKTRPAYIIKTPNHKQISDMIRAEGQQKAMEWLASEQACKFLF